MHPHTQAFYFLTFVIYVAPYLLQLLERCQYYLIGFQRGGWRWKQDGNGRRMEMEAGWKWKEDEWKKSG